MKKMFVKVTATVLLAALIAAPVVHEGGLPETMRVPSTLSIDGTPSVSGNTESISKLYPYSRIKATIKKYKEVNADVVGWLTIPGTNIHEPITFSDKNNIYYVKRDWRGTNYPNITWENWNKYPATATYLDYRVKIGETWRGTSKNMVLYGHNWNNLRDPLKIGNVDGYTMFAQLPSYTHPKFASDHPYIYFSTGAYEGVWKVFSVAYCELNPNFPYNTPNPSTEAFDKLIKEWQSRSMYDFSTEVDTTDHILTLSTCTRQYNVGDLQRFVVVARRLRDGESEDQAVKVTVNEDMKKPNIK